MSRSMKVYAALNHSKNPVSIVLARSQELASAYWQGKGIIPFEIVEYDEFDLENHPTGVLSLIHVRYEKTMGGMDKNEVVSVSRN